jgi:pyrimidine-nucleoside phosphorylase
MPLAAERTEVLAPKGGYLARFQNSQIGLTLIELGGGRKQKSDTIDHGVGFIFHKKIGDQIKKNEPLLTIYHHQNQRKLAHSLSKKFTQEIIHISSKKIKKNKTILEEIRQG